MTTPSPKYHWQFTERQGAATVDTVNGVKAGLFQAKLNGHGRIGNAIQLVGRDAHVNLGKAVGQFGTSDFTVAFGMRNISTRKDNVLDIIGDQVMQGHGNFFSVRLIDQQRIFFHVDEDSKAKHYVKVATDRLSMMSERQWLHVAVVRQGRTIKIYIDGVLKAEATSKTGVANIKNNTDVKLGHSRRGTPNAQYEDLRIYHTALNAAEIKALIPPVNRPLRAGEIELVGADKAAVILNENVDDLSRFSGSFKQLRVGNNTGVTLYDQPKFRGTAQKCYADLPDMRLSRIKNFPKSIRIWSTVGEPFTGKWIIKAPNGQFLHSGSARLMTTPRQSSNGLFKFHYNLQQSALQLLPGADQESDRFTLSSVQAPVPLFIDDSDSLSGEFSLTNSAKNEWLELAKGNAFRWTQQKEHRAVFIRAVKFAENEGQVGELAPGEVALYEHAAYHGRTWILSDNANVASGEHKRFGVFQNLNDIASSIRLGPDTGVTLFKHGNYQVAEDKREEQIEDIIKNVPWLGESQIGNDALSSLKIFRTIEPEDVFSSYTSKLSQDYRMVGDSLEEFSSYRTTLRFKPGAGKVEVSATDLTQIEVEGTTYDIDEVRSVTLSPNELNLIMITSEADGLNTPGLKIRTSDMAPNERVVIFPNREAHKQIAELEDGALWNAKDAKGNLIVDRNAHSKEEVASAQNTIKRVMATVNYGEDAPTAKNLTQSTATASVQSTVKNPVQSDKRVVSGATIENPWELTLGSTRGNTPTPPDDGQQSVIVQPPIAERPVSSDEWQQLLAQATPGEEEDSSEAIDPVARGPVTLGAARVFSVKKFGRRFGRRFKKAIKKATSVVIGKVKDVVHVVVKFVEDKVEKVVDFVVDTVEKVADFVEGVVETVVKAIKQFIEFLQFLFDWGDILETQRYLVRAVNSGFDFATQGTKDAKPLVSAFVDQLQGTVENGMNNLTELLGGDPSEVKESEFEMPEAFEWFLSKLLGGSKQKGAEPAPNLETNPNEGSAIESFFSNFLEAMENAIGAGLRVSEGLMESIQKLINNPRQPQLALIEVVEALRDAVIQSLSAVENAALGLLDIVGEAIQQLKNLLNAEIKIPFISDLFKLLGAGKLTILNLTTLLLAIPVTIVVKLTTNEKPFTDVVPLEPTSQAQTRLVTLTDTQTTDTQSDGNDKQSTQDNSNDIKELRRGIAFSVITTTADSAGHLLNLVLDATADMFNQDKQKTVPSGTRMAELISFLLSGISWGFSVPFTRSMDFKNNLEASLETLLWGYRTVLVVIDLCALGFSEASLGGARRMRRLNIKCATAWALLAVLDVGLATAYMIVAKENPIAVLYEIFSWLPDIALFSLVVVDRVTSGVIIALANLIASASAFGFGLTLVIQDGLALRRAKAA
ncbi:MAG: LamG domain-containing protein [Cyanobacteria bacterium P01_H01_bin.105]